MMRIWTDIKMARWATWEAVTLEVVTLAAISDVTHGTVFHRLYTLLTLYLCKELLVCMRERDDSRTRQ